MQRDKPLERRTELKRSEMKRSGRLKPRSKKKAELDRERALYVAEQLAARPWCEVRWEGCTGRSEHLHEPETRARFYGSAYVFDPTKDVATCLACHDRIHHDDPGRATREGLLVPSTARGGAE